MTQYTIRHLGQNLNSTTYSSLAARKLAKILESHSHQVKTEFVSNLSDLILNIPTGKKSPLLKGCHEVTGVLTLIPVWNTITGVINETKSLLLEQLKEHPELKILESTITITINHCLVGNSTVAQIKAVSSIQPILNQCSDFILNNNWETKVFGNSEAAAELLANNPDSTSAVITNQETAQKYNLNILAENTANQKDNLTTFVVIGSECLEFEKSLIENNIELEKLRNQIDNIDDQILELLRQRTEIVADIGYYKKIHNIPILQTQRWQELELKIKAKADQIQLDPELYEPIWQAIHYNSINTQNKI